MINTVKKNYTDRHDKLTADYKTGLISEPEFNLKHDALTHALDLWYLKNGVTKNIITQEIVNGKKRAYVSEGNGINDRIVIIETRQKICGVEDLEN